MSIKRLLWVLLFIFSIGLIFQCSNSEKENTEEEIGEARQEMISELKALQTRIDARIDDVDEQIKDAEGKLKDRLTETKTKMEQHKLELDYEIQKIKNTSDESWEDLNENAQNKLDEVEQSLIEAGRDIKEVFDADKVRDADN